MGSDDRAHDVTMDGTVLPSGDFGECSYRSDWGWVVRAMWVTPAPAAGDVATFVWSDGENAGDVVMREEKGEEVDRDALVAELTEWH